MKGGRGFFFLLFFILSSTENSFVHALCTCSTGRRLTFQITPGAHTSHSHSSTCSELRRRRVRRAGRSWGGGLTPALPTHTHTYRYIFFFLFTGRCAALNLDKLTVKMSPFQQVGGGARGEFRGVMGKKRTTFFSSLYRSDATQRAANPAVLEEAARGSS